MFYFNFSVFLNIFRRKFAYLYLLPLLILFIATSTVYSAAGSLDPTFGTNGIVFSQVSSFGDQSHAVALQTDGKIVAVGRYYNGTDNDFAVVRYNPDGTLDNSFDGDGKVTTAIGSSADIAWGVAIQADGKIVVAGNALGLGIAIVRYNSDGSLDNTFDNDGKVIKPLNENSGTANGVKIQPDGKIVFFGNLQTPTGADSVVGRLNPDGSVDTSFGNAGKAQSNASLSSASIYDAAFQADGKIVVATYVFVLGTTKFAAARYNSNGTLDTTFDGDGIVVTPVSDSFESVYAVLVQPDGKIVLGGYANISGADFALVRYNPDGSLDSSFGTGGKIIRDVSTQPGGTDVIVALLLQPNGKIVAVGNSQNPATGVDFTLVRFNSDGSLDTRFGNNGIQRTALGNPAGTEDSASDAVLQPDGKIVIAGYSGAGATGYHFALARFTTLSPPAVFDFDGDNKTDIGIFRPSDGSWWYSRSSDNNFRVFSFGLGSDVIAPGDFTGDGKTDIAVFRESTGEWFIQRSEDSSFFSFPFGAAGDVPVPSDFDGDGKTDAAVFRPSSGTWFILNSNGSGTSIVNFGSAEDKPVPADFDGNGKADIAIFRPSDGSWWYLRSSDAQFRVFRFGLGTDKPVQGDYTGDGKADLAVFRESTGEWFFQRSEDNSYFSVPFGANGDIPTPGDYDGDGRFDTAVFRPATADWFVQRSTAGILITSFGANGDRPIPNAFVP